MKLIIDIPKEIYQEAIKSGYSHLYDEEVANAIAEGTPLDDVKAEIRAEIVALPKTYPFINHIDTYVKEDDVLHILDNIGKESEEE